MSLDFDIPLQKYPSHGNYSGGRWRGGDEIDNGDSVTTKVRRMRKRERERRGGEQKQLVSHRGGDYVSTIFGIICSAVREPIYSRGDEKTIAGSIEVEVISPSEVAVAAATDADCEGAQG